MIFFLISTHKNIKSSYVSIWGKQGETILSSQKMDTVTWVQMLDVAVYIFPIVPGKSVNPTILSLAMDK